MKTISYSIALAMALLQTEVKPCSKHRVLNKLLTFFIISFTSWFFLIEIDDITVLLAPYDLQFFANVYYSLCNILTLVIAFEPI